MAGHVTALSDAVFLEPSICAPGDWLYGPPGDSLTLQDLAPWPQAGASRAQDFALLPDSFLQPVQPEASASMKHIPYPGSLQEPGRTSSGQTTSEQADGSPHSLSSGGQDAKRERARAKNRIAMRKHRAK